MKFLDDILKSRDGKERSVKHWLASKTIWFNAFVAALATAEASFGLLKPYLGDKWYGVALFVVTIGNVYLRSITTGPISASKTTSPADEPSH